MSTEYFKRRFCDRCGVEAVHPDDEVSHGWDRISIPTHPVKMDICDSCRTQLIKWWRDGLAQQPGYRREGDGWRGSRHPMHESIEEESE